MTVEATCDFVSVVVPSRQRPEHLAPLVEALLADRSTREVIVVVDGPDPAARSALASRAACEPRLKVIEIPHSGSARARHVGVEAATGEVVLLLDDDVVPGWGLVSGHARHHLHADRPKLVVGYMPTPLVPDDVEAYGIDVYARSYEEHCDRYERDPQAILTNLWGGNVSLPTAACRAVGVASSQYPGHLLHNDREFGLRCWRAGLEPHFDRSLVAVHRYRRTLERYLSDGRRQGAGGWLLHQIHGDLLGDAEAARPAGASVGARVLGRIRTLPRVGPLVERGGVALVRRLEGRAPGAVTRWMADELFVVERIAGRRLAQRQGRPSGGTADRA